MDSDTRIIYGNMIEICIELGLVCQVRTFSDEINMIIELIRNTLILGTCLVFFGETIVQNGAQTLKTKFTL